MGGYAPPKPPAARNAAPRIFTPKIRPAALGGQGVWGMKSPIKNKKKQNLIDLYPLLLRNGSHLT